jgi:transposase
MPQRMVYDNLKTVVKAIFADSQRPFNRRFMMPASHSLFEPLLAPCIVLGESTC